MEWIGLTCIVFVLCRQTVPVAQKADKIRIALEDLGRGTAGPSSSSSLGSCFYNSVVQYERMLEFGRTGMVCSEDDESACRKLVADYMREHFDEMRDEILSSSKAVRREWTTDDEVVERYLWRVEGTDMQT